MLQDQVFVAAGDADPQMTPLARDAATLGFEIVTISGFLDQIDKQTRNQLSAVREVTQALERVYAAQEKMRREVAEIATNSARTRETVTASVEILKTSSENSAEIAGWVQNLNQRMLDMSSSLEAVFGSSEEITSIAFQVHILAINTKIEAARAGESGRGFAVIAEAIGELSGRTRSAAEEIGARVTELTGRINTLTDETSAVSDQALRVTKSGASADAAIAEIAQAAEDSATRAERLKEEDLKLAAATSQFGPVFAGMAATTETTAQDIHAASARANDLIDCSERMVQTTVALGGGFDDASFIDRVKQDAAQIGALFEEAIAARRISEAELFTYDYRPVADSNPPQFLTPFTRLTDHLLPAIQEEALSFDPRVVFCAAVDPNGYLPTHNLKFSKPQGPDPVWNVANCRNRRIFDDRVGLKAGRNTEPFLLQVYRRDMGGGEFVMMKDLSAPIMVNGRHWGGLRLAYRLS